MSGHNDARHGGRPVHLVLIEQSGLKHNIPQPSTLDAMIEAAEAMHYASGLRQVKVVSQHTAVARWKPGERGWRRVA